MQQIAAMILGLCLVLAWRHPTPTSAWTLGTRTISKPGSWDSVELGVHLPHNVCIVCLHTTGHRVDGEIHLPREGRVNLRTGAGSIQLSNFRGKLDLQSSDGAQDIDSGGWITEGARERRPH